MNYISKYIYSYPHKETAETMKFSSMIEIFRKPSYVGGTNINHRIINHRIVNIIVYSRIYLNK